MPARAYLDYAGFGCLRPAAARAMRAAVDTSAGIHLVADGLDWRPGDQVVVFDRDFPANVRPWQRLAGPDSRGVSLSVVPMRDGGYRADDIAASIGPATRLVAVSHVNFATGFRCGATGWRTRPGQMPSRRLSASLARSRATARCWHGCRRPASGYRLRTA